MVSPSAVGQVGKGFLDDGQALGGRRAACDRACLLRQLAPILYDVEADDANSCCGQQPDGKLADQAEPDDASGIAKLDLSATHPVHGNRPDGGERRMFRQHASLAPRRTG